jgi:hypothetical protein
MEEKPNPYQAPLEKSPPPSGTRGSRIVWTVPLLTAWLGSIFISPSGLPQHMLIGTAAGLVIGLVIVYLILRPPRS